MNIRMLGYYREAYVRGWASDSYWKWRGSVIKRINKMYRTHYKNLSDDRILNYLEMSKFYTP